MSKQEFVATLDDKSDLSGIFDEVANITIPEWLMRSARPIVCFYETMKKWEKLKTKIKELSAPSSHKFLFPALKHHAYHFREILGFCEARPEMLKMIKTALYGVTYGCFEENQEDQNIFRYHAALNTVFDLMVMPQSHKCHRPEFMTEDGLVEKALASTIQNIFKIVLDQMRLEPQNDHIDYMVYACAHYGSSDSGYSRAARRAISNAFKDYYPLLSAPEKAMITNSIFYKQNAGTRELIDDLVMQARCHVATHKFQQGLPANARN